MLGRNDFREHGPIDAIITPGGTKAKDHHKSSPIWNALLSAAHMDLLGKGPKRNDGFHHRKDLMAFGNLQALQESVVYILQAQKDSWYHRSHCTDSAPDPFRSFDLDRHDQDSGL